MGGVDTMNEGKFWPNCNLKFIVLLNLIFGMEKKELRKKSMSKDAHAPHSRREK